MRRHSDAHRRDAWACARCTFITAVRVGRCEVCNLACPAEQIKRAAEAAAEEAERQRAQAHPPVAPAIPVGPAVNPVPAAFVPQTPTGGAEQGRVERLRRLTGGGGAGDGGEHKGAEGGGGGAGMGAVAKSGAEPGGGTGGMMGTGVGDGKVGVSVAAPAAAASPEPAHPILSWQELRDPTSGAAYFHNNVSQVTVWHRPDDMDWQAVTSADGATYYFNSRTHETVWELPVSTEASGAAAAAADATSGDGGSTGSQGANTAAHPSHPPAGRDVGLSF